MNSPSLVVVVGELNLAEAGLVRGDGCHDFRSFVMLAICSKRLSAAAGTATSSCSFARHVQQVPRACPQEIFFATFGVLRRALADAHRGSGALGE